MKNPGCRKLKYGALHLWAYGRHVNVNVTLRSPRGGWYPRGFRRIYNSVPGRWKWAWLADSGPVGLTVIVT